MQMKSQKIQKKKSTEQVNLSNEDMREADERKKFDKSSFVQKQTSRAFKEVMKHEYKLLSIHSPKSLNIDLKAYQDALAEDESQMLRLDKYELQKDKGAYLKELKTQFDKEAKPKYEALTMTVGRYLK